MLNQSMLPELQQEAAATRRMIERVPFDKWDWKPHAKSMSLGALTNHIVDLVNWVPFTLSSDGIDWKTFNYKGFEAADKEALLAGFDTNLKNATASLTAATDEQMMTPWTMRAGEQVYFTLPRIAVLRTFAFNHIIHHRAQLSVYLRLLDIPLPGVYGPTADEQ
jgi:uncharacterized damage-inducible protein DinB